MLDALKYYYDLKPTYDNSIMEASPFKAYVKRGNLYFVWNNKVMWEFYLDNEDNGCDINYMYRMGFKIQDKIVQYQALRNIEPLECQRLDIVKQRIFSYKYEELLYEIFSKKAEYSEESGFSSFFYPIEYNLFRDLIEKKLSITYEDSIELIKEFEVNNLIDIRDEKVHLGSTLDYYWWIISKEDNNFNKWCWTHKVQPIKKHIE